MLSIVVQVVVKEKNNMVPSTAKEPSYTFSGKKFVPSTARNKKFIIFVIHMSKYFYISAI